ncbi:MAG TPA: zf-HC2 domain-containing protein, partial [Dokdonella sp.]|nr:zf-HC2 domain-containing protein [Dokdonella sp.]
MNDDGIDDPGQRHREVWQLIPWLVNGTASAAERQRAAEHIAGCADCRDEVALQEQIRDGFAAAGIGSTQAAQTAFAGLAARLDEAASTEAPLNVPQPTPVRATAWTYALAVAVI